MHREHYRKGIPIAELFAADRRMLLPLPQHPFEAARYEYVQTDGYGKFTLQGRHTYSTSPATARQEVLVRLDAYDVNVLDRDGQTEVIHPRLFGERKQEAMDWLPYLTQLAKRPAALKYSGIHRMLPESLQEFLEQCDRSQRREALTVLAHMTGQSGFETAVDAFGQALRLGCSDADSVVAVFRRLTEIPMDFTGFRVPQTLPDLKELAPDMAQYQGLLTPKGGCDH